ncbi:MAG: putative bifunctional diguanylate cyclase/phosphodiesterase [Cypionkella sp.]
MKGSRAIGWGRSLLHLLGNGDAVSERVRRTLVRTLYAQPLSLAAGTAAGIISTGIAAYATDALALDAVFALLALVAAARLLLAWRISPEDERTSTTRLELLYLAGAFSYALLLGVGAAVTIVIAARDGVQALMLVNAVGYGVGVCARNAGRPLVAIGQLVLTALPLVVAALWRETLPYTFLAATIVVLIATMASIAHVLFMTLRTSIVAAETSAELADKMQVLARTDVVTGLANRAGLDHELAGALADRREERQLALFWIDLDRFKEVNDLLGHPVGDRVLIEVAQRLREVAPAGAAIARFGGDEFILLCEIACRAECERLAARVLDNVTRPLRVDDHRLEVPASMGIALLPEDGEDADALMQSADLALYHAKVGGRNHSRFYDPAMSRSLLRRREIERELRSAIQRDELSVFFQPIVDLETGAIRSFEALVRWFHPVKGELRPDEFIPVAEDTGVIVTLGNWITAQAARAAAHWPADVTLAVNLSPMQIKAPGAALGILAALRDAGLDPARLELEVTESLFLEDNHATGHFIRELSAAGVRFALDDFGTGYSSLGYIDRFPFTRIKVDRSFVSGPNVGRKSQAIIRAVAELGAQLDMEIVAEGLETIEQVHAVRAAGCSLGQGYYFSRAVPDYLAAMLLAQERENAGGRRAVG